jgi:hypothetical protein
MADDNNKCIDPLYDEYLADKYRPGYEVPKMPIQKPVKFEFTLERIQNDISHLLYHPREENNANLKKIHEYFPEACEQFVQNYNQLRPKHTRSITQNQAFYWYLDHAKDLLLRIPKLGYLIELNQKIKECDDWTIHKWKAGAKVGIDKCLGGANYSLYIPPEMKLHYSDIAKHLGLTTQLILEIAASCVLFQLPSCLIPNQRYREHFLVMIRQVRQWTEDRVEEAKALLEKYNANRDREIDFPQRQIHWKEIYKTRLLPEK